jgi:hypothetical protein
MLTRRIISASCIGLLFTVGAARGLAQSFSLSWFTVDGGGAMFSTGGNFELSGTIGQPDAGVATGGSFTLTGGFWSAVAPSLPGDCDADGDVDLEDHSGFTHCLDGPGGVLAGPECECFDIDGDGDADLADWAEFQSAFTAQ